jgi:Holliday junction resolvase-like predicted endonuclease
MKISETQKGAIAENLICNWLMSESDGRLSPYRPVADDGGIDLLVFDRKTRHTLLFQVKSRTARSRSQGDTALVSIFVAQHSSQVRTSI